ncbi:hypothetical protein [Vibrio fluvialis]|uniref:hypothetical protein n=1 Tax=Vibrio fluvialis TaxID=676 RepID=UPI001EEA9A3C|nr:hypothetical protein [Vibrio fluvialis]MCG6365327.1 hypothetical protein [Vibrio fluvialis]
MSEENQHVSKLSKWFCYTVFIGLIPIGLRLLSCIIMEGINVFSASDFIAFGFVLHISIINEFEHTRGDETWKSFGNTFSIVFLVLYSALMFASLVVESGYDKINAQTLTISSMILAVCSFILCAIIFYRLSARYKSSQQQATPKGAVA